MFNYKNIPPVFWERMDSNKCVWLEITVIIAFVNSFGDDWNT